MTKHVMYTRFFRRSIPWMWRKTTSSAFDIPEITDRQGEESVQEKECEEENVQNLSRHNKISG